MKPIRFSEHARENMRYRGATEQEVADAIRADGLREFRDQFTSLELQKKALEWWGD